MYESPVELIYGEIENRVINGTENKIYEAIQNVGVNVDKDELIRALQYDRQQYEKGYADGFAAGMARAGRDDEDD